jgi:ribosomal protein L7/L12
MLKYIVVAIGILIILAFVKRIAGRPPRDVAQPQKPKMISVEGGAVAAEIDGQEFDLDPATLADVRALAASGRKIEAIKRLRDATALDLAQAKDIVDSLERMPHK